MEPRSTSVGQSMPCSRSGTQDGPMRVRRAVAGSIGLMIGGTSSSHFISTSGLGAKTFSRYLPTKPDLINAAPGSPAWIELAAKDWGSADQPPWVVAPIVCSTKEGVPGPTC